MDVVAKLRRALADGDSGASGEIKQLLDCTLPAILPPYKFRSRSSRCRFLGGGSGRRF
jgi:hypothetical protein